MLYVILFDHILKTKFIILMEHVQSVPITPKVVSLNPAHGDVYSIQHYVIMIVSDLRQVFFRHSDFLHQ